MSRLTIEVTAWNNGKHSDTGAGYGLKVSAVDRDKLFDPAWQDVIVEMPDCSGDIVVNVAKRSFWDTNCRELIHKEIGRWLRNAGFPVPAAERHMPCVLQTKAQP